MGISAKAAHTAGKSIVGIEPSAIDYQERLRLALAAARLGDWVWDAATDVVMLSERAAEIFGLPVAPITWAAMRQLLHPEDRERARQAVEDALTQRAEYHIEYRVLRPGGEVAWVRATGRGNYADDRVVSMIGIVEDVTQRRAVEDALRASEQRYRSLFEKNIDGVFSVNAQGYFIDANPAALAICGYSLDELRSLHFLELCAPESAEQTLVAFERSLQGEVLSLETVLVRSDGQRRDLLIHGAPTLIAGQVQGVSGIAVDITERRQIEQALRESESKLNALVERVPVGIGIADASGRVISLNPAGLRIHGFDSLQQMLHHFEQYRERYELRYTDGRLMPLDEWPLARAFRGDYVRDYEVRLRRRDTGRERTISYTAVPLAAEPGQPPQTMFVMHDVTERKRAESAIDASRQQLQMIADAAPVMIAHCDIERRFLFVNHAYCRRFGLEREQVLGKTIPQVVGERAFANFSPQVDAALAGRYVEFEAEIPYEQLGERIVHCAYVPQHDAAGMVHSFVAVIQDVTERRRAEQALQESEHRLRSVLEATPECVKTVDPDGRLTYMNPAGLCMIEAQDKAVEGASVFDLIAPEHRDAWAQMHRRVCAGERLDWEFEIVGLQGTRRWMHTHAVPMKMPDGRFGQLAVTRDITARRHSEVALRESEERFRTLTDNISQLAWMADETGWIGWYNRRWFQYTGTDLEQMQGWGWQKVHHPDHVDRVTQKFRRHVETGEIWEDTFPLRGADGEYRWFLSRAVPVRDESNRVIRWFGTNTDITERMRMEEALKEADRRKDEFLAILGHELRNPLASIVHGIRLLPSLESQPQKLAEVQGLIERQAQHMARLTDDLLDVSRISRGKIHLRRQPLDLVALLQKVIADHHAVFEDGGRQLIARLPQQPIVVDGDPTRLAQIFANLLHNAAKFTDAGGRVELGAEVHPSRDEVIVSVTDTGIGISGELLPRLFQPFNQADGRIERDRGGLGLGLALVKALVQMHGGSVEAHSAGEGRGSQFTIRLPLTAQPVVDAPPSTPLPQPEALHNGGMDILLVEDSRPVAEVFAMILRQMGHRVKIASSGAAALDQLKTYRPQVLFSDISMPQMSGYELARRLRADAALRDVTLIAVTGYGQPEDRERAIAAGFDEHLVKPPEIDQLEALLKRISAGLTA